ncbi:MAG: HD domain-containing protein [Defluviitaleaceae bacterium]|nr:HD domain-containing protein [Defluviitaleaceae bacterium]
MTVKKPIVKLLAAVLIIAGLAVISVPVLASEQFLANYALTIYSTTYNNFPSDEANAVIQTRDGFMWFGGYNGLFRYDGTGFTIWSALTPGGFGSSSIRALYEDANGVLWIGTNDRGIVAFENGAFTVYGRDAGLPSNTVRTITSDVQGRIWGGTSDGLFYIDQSRNIYSVALDTALRPFVTDLAVDDYGNVFSVLNSGELYILTAEGQTQRLEKEDRARSVIIAADGRTIVGTNVGDVLVLHSHTIATPLGSINSLFVDYNGFVWLLAANGIGFLDADESFHDVGNPNGAGFYTDMWEDYQSGFWFTATRGGIAKLSPSSFTRVDTLIGMDSGPSNAVVMWQDLKFIGTDAGLMIFDDYWNPVHTEFSELFDVRVRGILACSNGYIWLATHDTWGIVRYNPADRTWINWTPDDGLLTDRTRFVHEISNGVMVVGTAVGVNFILGDDFVSVSDVFGGLRPIPDMMVLSSAYVNGTLFLGTDGNGIYAVGAQGYSRFTEADGLTGGVVLRVLYDEELNGVWVAASPGLSFIDSNGSIYVIDKVPPFAFLDIMKCGEDLLLMHSGAIMRTNASALLNPYIHFEYTAVYRSDGRTPLVNANAWNLLTPDGRLFFNTDRGVKIYNPETELTDFIPYAGVSGINIDGIRHTNFAERIIIPRNTYRLTIELSLLSFGLEDNTVLRFILQGKDAEIATLTQGDNMIVSYTNMRGGDYTLRVWTECPMGNVGNVIEIEFFKELAFFEHTLVWVIIFVLGVLGVTWITFAVTRYRTQALQARQLEYRELIVQSLTAIANTIDAKDKYTSGHSVRVATFSVEIARRMGMDKEFTENLYYIGLLHDVGKIGIPNEIINKPGKLTDDEYNSMKTHTAIGFEILKGITAIPNLTAGAIEHHERWDGKGYQNGISGENISLQARIIAIADTYDAMSSDRSYRKALPKEAILQELKKCEGTQFDPHIASIAIELIENGDFEKIDTEKITNSLFFSGRKASKPLAHKGILLLVDNDPETNNTNRSAFEFLHYKVFTAEAYYAAKQLLNDITPDIILTEATLPDGDGFEFCKEIRSVTSAGVVFLTSKVEDDDMLKGINAGCVDYIKKPVNTDVLTARVEAIMRRRKM